jgi:hypothetical protein
MYEVADEVHAWPACGFPAAATVITAPDFAEVETAVYLTVVDARTFPFASFKLKVIVYVP